MSQSPPTYRPGSGGRPRSSVTTAGAWWRTASIAALRSLADDDVIVLIGPPQLALQALVVLDDQQFPDGSWYSSNFPLRDGAFQHGDVRPHHR